MSNKNRLHILFIILNQILAGLSHGQPNYAVFEHLFDSSHLVVQGVIIRKDCKFNEVGVLDCNYSIKIDSIFKGEILLEDLQLQKYLNDSSGKKVIIFSKDCLSYLENPHSLKLNQLFKDICYERNDNIIVFLKRIQQIDPQTQMKYFYFKLTDSWLGVQQANSYMAIELRGFVKFEYLRKKRK